MLTNRKSEQRRGRVQLIDATGWNRALRRDLGKKNCELGEDDIARVCNTFLAFEETEHGRIFDNADFGYWKITVEQPLHIKGVDHKPKPLRTLAEIRADILALEGESGGLLAETLGFAEPAPTQ